MATQMDVMRQQMSSMKSNIEAIGVQLSQVVDHVSSKPPVSSQLSYSSVVQNQGTNLRQPNEMTHDPVSSPNRPGDLFSASPKVQQVRNVRHDVRS